MRGSSIVGEAAAAASSPFDTFLSSSSGASSQRQQGQTNRSGQEIRPREIVELLEDDGMAMTKSQ